MKQKLLYLFIAVITSVASYAQYANPMDLTQCNNEVFNLSVNTPIILNGQNPAEHTVTYYASISDAINATNPLNPILYVAPQNQVIHVRVDHAGNQELFQFTVHWDIGQQVIPMPDVFACDAYMLPFLQVGEYRSAPNGGGVVFPFGSMITTTTTLYVYSGNGMCSSEESFTVHIIQTPIATQLANVTACGSYTLPALNPGMNYNTAPNGFGLTLAAGTVISTSATIYIFATTAGSGNGVACTSETSFNVTINPGTPASLSLSPPSTLVCPGSPVTLTATTDFANPTFVWLVNGMVIPGATGNNFVAMPFQNASYQCMIQTDCGSVYSPQSFIIVTGGWPEMVVSTSGETCVGGSFTLAVANPDITTTYIWSHEPAGGSVSTASNPWEYTVGSATAADAGTYTCTAMSACGSMMTTSIVVEIGICNNNTISGHVRFDADANGCTASDGGVPNLAVAKYMGNDVAFAYTNAQGKYSFTNVPEAPATVLLQSMVPGYVLTSPDAPGGYSFNVVGNENALIGDFCLGAQQLLKDVAVYFYATSGARPGFPATYYMVLQNVGGLPVSGTASVSYNPGMLDLNYTVPGYTGSDNSPLANTLDFTVTNLAPFAYVYYDLGFTVKVPPIVNANDVLNFTAVMDLTGDVNPSDNEVVFNQVVVNSFDPNDIMVRQGDSILEAQVTDFLDYTIRFQNTGTADAINVRITNELDDLLDWSTFTPVYSSHGYRTERVGKSVTFSLDNINLPAESVDEAGSNGFVAYKIKPKANVTLGDVIKAQANIYFDFNLPIITNEVSTEVVQVLGVAQTPFANLKMYPNPASSKVTIDFNLAAQASAIVYDIQGKMILKGSNLGRSIELDVSSVKAGMYFVEISSGKESVMRKLIVK